MAAQPDIRRRGLDRCLVMFNASLLVNMATQSALSLRVEIVCPKGAQKALLLFAYR